jgi:hypothetical protein
MLESIKGLSNWCHKDYRVIYGLWKWKIVKQDELDGDLEFTTKIGLKGKLASYWKTNKRQSWKWKGICKAYKNPISESDVGKMSSDNKITTCKAQVVSTTRGGAMWSMDWGSLEKT